MISCIDGSNIFPADIKDAFEGEWNSKSCEQLIELFQKVINNLGAVKSVHREQLLTKLNNELTLLAAKDNSKENIDEVRRLALTILLEGGVSEKKRGEAAYIIENQSLTTLQELNHILSHFDETTRDSAFFSEIFTSIHRLLEKNQDTEGSTSASAPALTVEEIVAIVDALKNLNTEQQLSFIKGIEVWSQFKPTIIKGIADFAKKGSQALAPFISVLTGAARIKELIDALVPKATKIFEATTGIANAIGEMPQENWGSISVHAIAILKGITDEELSLKPMRIQRTIEAIQKVDEKQRNDVVAKTLPFIETIKPFKFSIIDIIDKHLENIFNAISAVPENDRNEVLAAAQKVADDSSFLTHSFINKALLPEFIHTLHEIPATADRADVVNSALFCCRALTNSDPNPKRVIQLVKIMAAIPPEERADIIDKTLAFRKYVSNESLLMQIITSIAAIPLEDRELVISKTMPLIRAISDEQIQTRLLKTIATIPLQDVEDIVRKTLPLNEEYANTDSETLMIVKAIATLPSEGRGDAITKAEAFIDSFTFPSMSDAQLLAEILNVLATTPRAQWKAFLTATTKLITGDEQYSQRELFNTIYTLPPGSRMELFHHVTPLLRDLSPTEKLNMLRTLAAIRKEDIGDVVQKTNSLLENLERPSIDDKEAIINAIARIDKSDDETPDKNARSEILTLAKPFIKEIPQGDLIAAILDTIDQTPKTKRSDLIHYAQKMMTPECDENIKVFIFKTIASLLKENDASTLEKITLLIKNMGNDDDVITRMFLDAIHKIPEEERNDVLAHNQELVDTTVKPWIDFGKSPAPLLRTIADTPREERAALIVDVKKVIEATNTSQITAVLRAAAMIPTRQQRAAVVNKVLEQQPIPSQCGAAALIFLVSNLSTRFHDELLTGLQKEELETVLSSNSELAKDLYTHIGERVETLTSYGVKSLMNNMKELNLWDDELFETLAAKDIRFAEMALEHNIEKKRVLAFLASDRGQKSLAQQIDRMANSQSNLKTLIINESHPTAITYRLFPEQFEKNSTGLTVRTTLFHPLKEAKKSILDLSRYLIQPPDTLYVNYKGQAGIDAGGLSRDYISKLFEGLVEARVIVDGRVSWDPNKKKECVELYQAIADVFIFILKSTSKYHTGQVFDSKIFELILQFFDEELSQPFPKLPRQRQVELLLQLDRSYDRQPPFCSKLIALLNARTLNDELEEYITTMDDYGSFPLPEMTDDNLAVIQDEVFRQFSDSFEGQIHFLYQVAKKLKDENLWRNAQHLGVDYLNNSIQGTFNHEGLINAFEFGSALTPELKEEYRQVVRDWVQTAKEQHNNDKKLKNFLSFVTGAPVLPSKKIKIFFVSELEDNMPVAHSCSMYIDLPLIVTEENSEAANREAIKECFANFLNSFQLDERADFRQA